MAGRKTPPTVLIEALALVSQHGGVAQAARAAGIPIPTFESRVQTARMALMRGELKNEAVAVTGDGPPPSTLFDERWDTFNRWIGRSSRASKQRVKKTDGVILHLSDCHIPYLDEQALALAVDSNPDASRVVLGGDALNCGAFSRFIEGTLDNPRDEFAQLTQLLLFLSERFVEVRCNLGNHPDRVRKFFANRGIPPYMMFLVQSNPIQFVIEGLRKERGINNIEIAKPVVLDTDTASWLTFVGQTAFTHAETHGKLSTRPAENSCRWLRRWQRHLPVWPDAVIQEHNHRGAKFYDEELGALLIQAPCLSKNQGYQTEANIKYNPNQIGWVRVVQHVDGSINVNETNYYLAHGRSVIDGREVA